MANLKSPMASLNHSNWEYWNDLPTSNPKYKRIDDLDEKAGALTTMLLDKHTYASMNCGDGACLGCGEKTIVHLFTSTVRICFSMPVISWSIFATCFLARGCISAVTVLVNKCTIVFLECVEVCHDEALEPAPQTVESIQSLRDDWEYWNDLPTSNPKYKRIDDIIWGALIDRVMVRLGNGKFKVAHGFFKPFKFLFDFGLFRFRVFFDGFADRLVENRIQHCAF
jgi:hypothetical protein